MAKQNNAPTGPTRSPANRLELDYHDPPLRKVNVPVVDVHSHVKTVAEARLFFRVAAAYDVWHVVSMTPLPNVPALAEAYPDRVSFVAIPDWREKTFDDAFQQEWIDSLVTFRGYGAKICKFWSAPPMRANHGMTLDQPFMQPIIDRALDLGFLFMTHIADPTAWFAPGGRYEDHAKFGTKDEQYDQLEFFLEKVAPRPVIGAHMGGRIEELDRLTDLLERYPHYHLDTSATKWIVRGVAAQPERVRELMLRFQDRILFGSDLVTGDNYDYDHYASRYWTHQMLWETDYRGESPIEDPDANDPPQLAGVNLPQSALRKIYLENAERLGIVGGRALYAVA
jgi:predicted TIM-barrel fold metal-dependent hydrolase